MIKVQISLDFDKNIEKHLFKKYPDIVDFRIISKSLDARNANKGRTPKYHYIIEVLKKGESFSSFSESIKEIGPFQRPPIIIGAGPAGLFCALRFVEYGIPCLLFERGDRAINRMKYIAKFWRYGEFNRENNVCFGEGGAGLFSDGKLITRVKSPFVQYVMNKFVEFGAPKETAYISNPHLGSNKIRSLINKISDYLLTKGCEIFYNTRIDEILIEGNKIKGVQTKDGKQYLSDHIVLAVGHSAHDMYKHLNDLGVEMAQKSFAVGVRIEHQRSHMDKIQLGDFAGHELLGASRYRVSWQNKQTNKGTYSFCMCPGGYVLSSGTERDGIVVNGMSNYSRNSPWSNSALVVSVEAGKDFMSDNVLNGLYFQREIEKKAYNQSVAMSNGISLPAQSIKEFLENKNNYDLKHKSSSPSKIFKGEIREILPSFIVNHLKDALEKFDHSMPGFASDDALLIAPETRTSAPITILRDKQTLESTNIKGLFPCGEGAGYAGGITSAAVDGIKIAESIVLNR